MTYAVLGTPVPQVCLLDNKGNQFCLADTKGKWTVLYFYPRDHTPGCTIEAKEFSDQIERFQKHNVKVFGISPDTVASHNKFAKKHKLKVTLLSDPGKKFIESFGVWIKKKMYGREYLGVERSTFLIDPEGNLKQEWRNVNPVGHARVVLEKIRELSN